MFSSELPCFPIILHKCLRTHSQIIPSGYAIRSSASSSVVHPTMGERSTPVMRNILQRIIQDPEIIQKCNNLCCGKISGSGRRIGPESLLQPALPQKSLPIRWQSGAGSQYLHTVQRSILSRFPCQAQGHVPTMERIFPAMARASSSLSFSGASTSESSRISPSLSTRRTSVFTNSAILSLRKRGSRIQSCRLIVINSTQIRPHDLPENKVDTFQNFRSASEIFVKIDPLLQAVCPENSFCTSP